MKKRVLSMLLVVVLLLSSVPFVTVSAETTPEKVDIVSLTYKAYRSQLAAENYAQRDWDNSTLMGANKNNSVVKANVDDGGNKGGTIAYKAQSRNSGGYYPSIYLNDEGKLVRDTSYDGKQETVNLTDYLANGQGEYYGYYTLELAKTVYLDTFRVYNNNGWWHLNGGFDVLVSADGTTWTKKASYSGMGDHAKWDNGTNYVSIDGASCVYVDVDMGGTEAKYVAVAITAYACSGEGNTCTLWYAEATGTPTEVTVSTIDELKAAIEVGNGKIDYTIKLANDIVCEDDTTFGTLKGTGLTIDGQGHTIYNLRGCFSEINGAGVTVKNLVISNKVSAAADAAEMDLKSGVHLFGGTWGKIAGGTAERPVVIENVVNQRNVTNVTDMSGLFARTVGGYVTFKNCVNEGDHTATTGGNYKLGGFVGALEDNGIVLTFISCVNKGNISGSQAGGFVGVLSESASNIINMTDCTNSGTITGYAGGSGGCYGIAGGFIAGVNNRKDVTGNISISLVGCTNNGDVLLGSVDHNDWGNAVGGFIGHAGNHPNSAKFEILIDNCAVYNCAIDAANEKTNLKFYAAGFVGKISPQGNSNVKVLVKNSYLSKVSIAAVNARKFVGVGSHTVDVVFAENCMIYDVVETNQAGEVVEWNVDAMAGCKRTFSANADTKTGFVDTDAKNIISAGGKGFVQTDVATGKSDIRFVATLPEGFTLEDYEKVGFYVVALTDADTDGYTERVWIKSASCVYESIKADGVVKSAGQICDGAEYLFVAEITGISQLIGEVEFYVVPYIIANDGSIIYGQSSTYTVDTGVAPQNP